jgi:hypothetical protein
MRPANQDAVTGLIERTRMPHLKGWGDLILIMKGNTTEFLEEKRDFLLEEIRQEVAKTVISTVGVGVPQTAVFASRLSSVGVSGNSVNGDGGLTTLLADRTAESG